MKEDVEQQNPLEDRAGQELRSAMAEAGVDLASAVVVHAVACMRKQPEADPEMRKALVCCRPLFDSVFKKLSLPTLLVGKWAFTQAVGKEKAIGTVRGFYEE